MRRREMAFSLCIGLGLACTGPKVSETPTADSTEAPAADEMVISGVALDPEGKPVPEAKVVVSGTDYNHHTQTDAEGRFEHRVPRGDFTTLSATSPGAGYTNGKLHGLGAMTTVWIDQPRVEVRLRLVEAWEGEVDFSNPHLEAQEALRAEIQAYWKQRAAELRDNSNPEPHINDVLARAQWARTLPQAEPRRWFRAKIEAESDPIFRRLLVLYFFQYPSLARGYADAPPDPELANELLESVEPDSRWWTVSPGAVWNAVTETGEVAKWEAYMDRVLTESPSPFVGDFLLAERMLDAWLAGQHDEVKALRTKPGGGHTVRFVTGAYDARFGEMAIGKPMPDFGFTTLEGERVSPDSLAGRPYLLYFWAPWCGGCKQDFPALARLHEERRDLDVVTVSIAEPGAFREFVSERGPFGWTQVLIDPDGSDEHERFVRGYPTWFVVSKEGTILEVSGNHKFSKPGHSQLFEHVTTPIDARNSTASADAGADDAARMR